MSAPEAFVERIPVDGMVVALAYLSLDGPCIFSVLCNGKKLFVELLPPNHDPAASEPDYSYDIMHGFNPGPRYSPVLAPLPGYDPSNSIELMYLTQLYEKMYPTESLVLDKAGNQILNKIHNLIVTIGSSTIRDLAGYGKGQTSRETLENALNPETILLQIVTIDREAKLIRRDDFVLPTREFEPEDVSGVNSDLPLFSPFTD